MIVYDSKSTMSLINFYKEEDKIKHTNHTFKLYTALVNDPRLIKIQIIHIFDKYGNLIDQIYDAFYSNLKVRERDLKGFPSKEINFFQILKSHYSLK